MIRRGRNFARRQTADATMVRLGATVGLLPVLEDLGVDPARLLTEAGADISLFDNPDNRVSYAARNHWVAYCVERTGCRHLGLLIGQRNSLRSMGLVGLLAKYSHDVESALRSLTRYFGFHVRGAVCTFDVVGRTAMLGFETYVPRVEANDQVEDASLATAFNILRELCGPDWNATEIRFAHRKPEDLRPFREFFRTPLLFDDVRNAVVFHSSWLQHRLVADDPDLFELLRNHFDLRDVDFGDDFPEQVRGILRTALLTGHGSADQIASMLSIHSRTLHRRLAESGTRFRGLVDESRFTIARQMLTETDAEIGHVAEVLGYADSSAFARAFRRWSGYSPGNWRTRNQPLSTTARGRPPLS